MGGTDTWLWAGEVSVPFVVSQRDNFQNCVTHFLKGEANRKSKGWIFPHFSQFHVMTLTVTSMTSASRSNSAKIQDQILIRSDLRNSFSPLTLKCFFFKWSYWNWIDSAHLFLVSTCFTLLCPHGDSAAVLSCYFWCGCWTDRPVCPQTFIRSNGEQRLWLRPTFHTLASTLQCGPLLCVALISACAALSRIAHCQFTSDLRVLFNCYFSVYFLFNSKMQTDGTKSIKQRHINT